MPSESLIEQPIPQPVEAPRAPDRQKVELPDGKFEKVSPVVEKINKPVFPPKESSANNIIVSSQIQDGQQQRAKAIDAILSEGLDGVFLGMKPKQQQEFKVKGEETVKQINVLLSQTKIKVKKIIGLIRSWLKIIPGVNKFFLEQESKIKADKIVGIKNKF